MFYINMDRSKDRRHFIERNVAPDVPQLQRIPGVDGSKLDLAGKDARLASLITRYNIKNDTRQTDFEIDRVGAVGCTLSHKAVWEAFLETGKDHAVVFEDDLYWSSKHKKQLLNVLKRMPDEADIVLLGCNALKTRGFDEDGLWDTVLDFFQTHAYIITREAVKKLLPEMIPVEVHMDAFLARAVNVHDMIMIRPRHGVSFKQGWAKSTINHGKLLELAETQEQETREVDRALIGYVSALSVFGLLLLILMIKLRFY